METWADSSLRTREVSLSTRTPLGPMAETADSLYVCISVSYQHSSTSTVSAQSPPLNPQSHSFLLSRYLLNQTSQIIFLHDLGKYNNRDLDVTLSSTTSSSLNLFTFSRFFNFYRCVCIHRIWKCSRSLDVRLVLRRAVEEALLHVLVSVCVKLCNVCRVIVCSCVWFLL